MIRLLARAALMVLANAAGMIVAAILLPNFRFTNLGFIISVVFFTVSSIILEPLILKIAIKYIPAMRGGIALVSTFVGLLLTMLFTDSLRISGLATWIIAPLIVWVFSLIAAVILPLFLFKKALGKISERSE